MASTLPATPEAFIDHWTRAEANERANSQAFLLGLAHLLGVPAPSNSHADGYSFEYPVKVPGGSSTNFIDLYRRGHFVFESKQFAARREELSALEAAAVQAGAIAAAAKKSGPVRDTGAWSDAMIRAKGQAERYVRSLPAEEPNPPFIGKVRLREDLGDGYAETLRKTYPDVPDSADLVLYWWHKAALLVRSGKVRRFGLITTNSLRQTFARRVVEAHLKLKETDLPSPPKEGLGKPLSLLFAIPDHPWVDTEEGAAVRIAMTVGAAGLHEGTLLEVIDEIPHEDGSSDVTLRTSRGRIAADLSVGADVTAAKPLKANEDMTSMGIMLAGRGFVITHEEAMQLGGGTDDKLSDVLRPIRNGKDLTDGPRNMWVIDFTGLTAEEARSRFPALFQIILTRVKPERDANRDAQFREKWWLFGRSRPDMRALTKNLRRYIATVETAKHRIFQFLDSSILPEHKLVMVGSDDAYTLGLLSSRIHVTWALAAGGWLGVGNDPVYSKTRCFDPFPFPICGEAEKERIRALAEELDAHRKRVQAQHPGLTLTGMYNVLEKLRHGEPLTPKDKLIHDQGLVSLLQQLHDDLDAAVFAAYGWQHLWQARQEAQTGTLLDFRTNLVTKLDSEPEAFTAAVAAWERTLDAEILQRLVHLNAQRADEEKRGIIHWLRPDYQSVGQRAKGEEQDELALKPKKTAKPKSGSPPSALRSKPARQPWPKPLADRIRAVEAALHAAAAPVTAADLSKHFTSTKPAALQEILESLAALGRARVDGERFAV